VRVTLVGTGLIGASVGLAAKRAGAEVVGFDPIAGEVAKEEVPELLIAPDPYDAAEGAHCVVIGTESDDFRTLDLARLRQAMRYPVILDGRNLLVPEVAREVGFLYMGIGRPPRETDQSPQMASTDRG
jgi:UDPglucose 6-dehydrogenase